MMTLSSSEMGGLGLLVGLRHRGLKVDREGARLRVSPKSALTPELRETLASRKADLLSALSLEARILQMPIDQFELEGRSIEVRVAWLPATLWFVPGESQVEALTKRGISRGRIWTARELRFLWSTSSIDKGTVEKLGRIKAELGGDFVSLELPDRENSRHA
jgi:tubulysin polyketide synthase-like protein